MPRRKEEDWLVGYLASTAYGKDPKLNASTLKKKPETTKLASKASAPCIPDAIPEEVTKIEQNEEQLPGLVQPAEAAVMPQVLMLRKMAASQSLARPHTPSGDIVAMSKTSAAADGESFENWVASSSAHQRRRASTSCVQRPSKEMLQEDAATAEVEEAQGKSPRSPAKVLGPRRKSISKGRASVSGRRQSMDYSELDAIRERLQHAASVWAVSEDDDGMNVEVETEVPDASATKKVKVPVLEGPVNAAYLVDTKATRISLMAFKKLLPMSKK